MRKIPEIIKITARKLQKNQTACEKILWEVLKDRKIGYKFQRQFCLYVFSENSGQDRYIIPDLYCSEKKLIIEIDGIIHNRKDVYELDLHKEEVLTKQGYSLLRFTNEEILQNTQQVLQKIISFMHSLQPLSLEKRENSSVSLGLCEVENSSMNSGSHENSYELSQKRFIMRNESFLCENCGKEISKHPTGSARNHCPYCLYSKHLDKDFPGDRASDCHALMKPVAKDHKKKGWMIVHECQRCGKKIPNILASDDNLEIFAKL